MSLFYDDLAQTSIDLINEYGVDGQVKRMPEGGVMTAAGNRVVEPIPGACRGVRVGAQATLIDGVEKIATKNILAPLLAAPEPGDRLALAGNEDFVLRCDTMAPDGTTLYHTVWT